jgi:hypothetical protein
MKKTGKRTVARKTTTEKKGTAAARKAPVRETLTEAYEVRAFRDEMEEPRPMEVPYPSTAHAEPGALQKIKASAKGHGEQTVIPDDCQYGDNDLCYVDA